MSTTTPVFGGPRHERNAWHKAQRALAAIRTIVRADRPPDRIWVDERAGLAWFMEMLFGETATRETAEETWGMIGAVDALNRGTDEPTSFDTSRMFVRDALAAEIDNPVDPFEAIGF